ncbi:MAG TPA: HPP family protein [Longimicrobiaceae bacterium]|nr:HPP family protein [Longimicrobiaceae bacterium]
MAQRRAHHELESVEPGSRVERRAREQLGLKGEFLLALPPTLTVLAVLGLVDALSSQQLLFASLAGSAFLIYLDPQHGTNAVRTLIIAQLSAALLGLGTFLFFGHGYLAAASAVVAVIVVMILADAVHPPAVATAMIFALRAGGTSNLMLFGLAVGVTAVLVVLERLSMWTLARHAQG